MRTVRARVAIVLLLAALPAVATAAARPTLVGTAAAPTSSPARDGLGPHRRARPGTTGSPRSTTAASTGSRCGTGTRHRRRRCPRPRRRRLRGRQHAHLTATGTGTPGASTSRRSSPTRSRSARRRSSVFQVGRNRSGGAASIGFATSSDEGRTWREGILPGLTVNTLPAGPSISASDPVVAYDAAHGVWLANTLAIAQGVTRLTIHRSPDGLTWTGPIDAALTRSEDLAYDKNWLTCDNGAASPFRGRCYLAYTLVADAQDAVAVQRSDDGGRTWSPPVTLQINVTGVIPVVQPNGMLSPRLLVAADGHGLRALDRRRSRRSASPSTISPLRSRNARPFRAPPLDRRRRRRGRTASLRSGRTAASTRAARRTTSCFRARRTG